MTLVDMLADVAEDCVAKDVALARSARLVEEEPGLSSDEELEGFAKSDLILARMAEAVLPVAADRKLLNMAPAPAPCFEVSSV